MIQYVLNKYGIKEAEIKPFGNGLINHTWIIKTGADTYILQQINHQIFKKPTLIAENIKLISDFLILHHPQYLFVSPIQTLDKKDTVFIEAEGYYRIFPFVKNSHTVDVVLNSNEAYEASKQFGRFTKLLNTFNSEKLHITLPDFHNLSLRYSQFETALELGNKERILEASKIIIFLKAQKYIASDFEKICTNNQFKKRVTHHDTKISNVLLDEKNRGLCVIDLDTVMPGYFISDVGDMMRTYLSPVSEEEKDFSKIEIRAPYFKAIADGYLSEMKDELSKDEKSHFIYAGKFMIYMQALRFITDYLNDDVYYGAKYEGQNFIRGGNQVVLLQKLIECENELQHLLDNILI